MTTTKTKPQTIEIREVPESAFGNATTSDGPFFQTKKWEAPPVQFEQPIPSSSESPNR